MSTKTDRSKVKHPAAPATARRPRSKAPVEQTDWQALAAMTDAEVVAAALTDPDNLPRTAEQLARAKRRPRVFVIRRALQLSQDAFAARFQIPLGTLRDWEQGRTEPDQAAKAYLKVIAADAEFVARVVGGGAQFATQRAR